MVVLQRGESRDKLVVGDHVVLILVEAAPKQAQTLVARVCVRRAQEAAHVVQRHVPLVFLVDCLEGRIKLDRCFIDDSLADEFDRDFALDEPSQEALEKLASLSLEVLFGVGLRPVEATTRIDQDRVV